MTLQRCQAETTSTEFLEWQYFLSEDFNTRKREDFYFAQLTQEIRKSWVAEPEKVTSKQFLIEFETTRSKNDKTSSVEKALGSTKLPTKEEWLASKKLSGEDSPSKAIWMGIVHGSPKKKD